jgi:hypothetical protein
LKGDPEYEVHILGQIGSTDSLKTYQCAGEHASGPYMYDQNSPDWTGSVLLFSQTQVDNYKAQHPGQSFRVFLVEDDDTACQIKNGNNTLEDILDVVDALYSGRTGARDTTTGSTKTIKNAKSFQDILTLLAHLLLTNDEMVGNAIEDVVAGSYYTGANWIVKGENNVTNGWIKLVMR